MKLTFLGADHEVTGSCHFLQAAGLNILVIIRLTFLLYKIKLLQ